MKTITLYVTEADIAAAALARLSGDELSKTCPIAQALKRQGIPFMRVYNTRVLFDVVTESRLSRGASRFIADYDEYRIVTPRYFRVSVPA